MTIKLTTLAKRNMLKVDELANEQGASRKQAEDETRALMYDIYQPRIRGLENERDEKIKQLQDKAEAVYKKQAERITELYQPVKQVERILELLRMNTRKPLQLSDADVCTRNEDYKEALGILYQDEYIKAKIYIIENGKPVNKYSLCVMGRCLFPEHILKLTRGYISGCYVKGNHLDLEFIARDFPTKQEAQAWLEPRREGPALMHWLDSYIKVKDEYIKTKAEYKRRDFKEFIILQCKCGFFYTTFDKRSYSNYYFDEAVNCPHCNKTMTPTS